MSNKKEEAKEIELDIEDIRNLIEQSKRPYTKSLLTKSLNDLTSRLKAVTREDAKQPARLNAKPAEIAEVKYRPIDSFGWEQNNNVVKVRVASGVDGVGELSRENVQVLFTSKSFELIIKELRGVSYKLKVDPLNSEIIEKDSRYQVKSNSVTVTLAKRHKVEWTDLKAKFTMFDQKVQKAAEKGADSYETIKNMMQTMYENGDDEMRSEIMKSWAKTRDEKFN
eukprot:TRINITY_DN10792_c0_g1_i1.p1 TRINITY_DN10792_c0_g1~~TRINITY_DN10792_c0_g1_i1.p1  ORF type:complete len:224 (-),score=35.66 TRINITY_DN10792_c0_g1_i1:69-740(-)